MKAFYILRENGMSHSNTCIQKIKNDNQNNCYRGEQRLPPWFYHHIRYQSANSKNVEFSSILGIGRTEQNLAHSIVIVWQCKAFIFPHCVWLELKAEASQIGDVVELLQVVTVGINGSRGRCVVLPRKQMPFDFVQSRHKYLLMPPGISYMYAIQLLGSTCDADGEEDTIVCCERSAFNF